MRFARPFVPCLLLILLCLPSGLAAQSWPGWGGPAGDFQVDAEALAENWPAEGPPVIWNRPLGAGYSGVAAADGVLYTHYRDGEDEIVVALGARDGKTVWEHRYAAPSREGNTTQFGTGPHATPLVLPDRILTLGYTGVLNALARKDGAVLWSHDLIEGLGGDVLSFGYSASPILHDDKVVVLVGGKHAVVALEPAAGAVAWKSPSGSVSYATPIVIDVQGQEQILYFASDEIVGIEPGSGKKLWSHPCKNDYENNSTGPLWNGDGLLWAATQTDGGTRALRLSRKDGQTVAEEVWRNDKIAYHFWNSLRLGDHAYASIGSNGSILAGMEVKTGKILWRERGFQKINFVHAGEATLLLDEDGTLAIARLSPEGLTILARATVVDGRTWTAPTLLGTTLIVRDREEIRALDLGPAATGSTGR